VTCDECGDEAGTSSLCVRCGPAARSVESGRQLYVRILVGIVSLAALAAAIMLPVGYASQNRAQDGPFFMPLAAFLPSTIICASVPVITAGLSIRWLRRRARERRSVTPDTPVLPPQTLD